MHNLNSRRVQGYRLRFEKGDIMTNKEENKNSKDVQLEQYESKTQAMVGK